MTDSKNKLSNFIENPSLALWKLSIPMMLGMSVQAIYMLIDTAFIGKWVGSNALAGLGLIFPPMFIIMGITFGLGSGATTVIAQEIGKGKKQKRDNGKMIKGKGIGEAEEKGQGKQKTENCTRESWKRGQGN